MIDDSVRASRCAPCCSVLTSISPLAHHLCPTCLRTLPKAPTSNLSTPMADSSFRSDTDDSAVEEIISEAIDHSVLKQVAALNCASFSDSVLPHHLESRFQRLKTFPSSSNPPPTQFESPNKNNDSLHKPKLPNEPEPPFQQNPKSSPSSSSNSSFEKENRSKPKEKEGVDAKWRSGSFSFRSNSSPEMESPPRKSGCLWCSPKKRVSRKKSKGSRVGGLGIDWGKTDEIFGDLGSSFSSKEHKKILKKAMKEEEKISREAEKIVKWAKQASARMDVSSFEDELSDHDDSKPNFGVH
ncbi:hypothetical protein Ancab_015814 [Ancistrocladus abbreviatus]